jgi:archaemetzincin
MRVLLLLILPILFSCQSKRDNEYVTVGIQPYKDFPKDKTDTISKIIADIYKVKTIVLPVKELDKKAFVYVKSPRYRADSIIKFQKIIKPDSLDYILGLTHKDISVTKKDKSGKMKTPTYKYADWGIMGLAYCPGKSCIVSTFRIKHPNAKTHFSRLKKVAVHEFGHNLGLPHCPNKTCVMTDAVESVKTIDNAKLALCNECKLKIN